MKKAFTMIELIFIIVIIGILSALAIPKLTGIFSQSKISKIVAYAGTLQRTTIPPYWSASIMAGSNGEINTTIPASTVTYEKKILADLEYPAEFPTTPHFDTAHLEPAGYDFNNSVSPTKIVATSNVLNGITYKLVCSNGNKSIAPRCDVWDGSKWMLASTR